MNFLFAEQGINYKLELGRSNHLIVENPNAIDSLVTSLKERVLKQSEAVNIYDGDILDFNKLVQVCFSPVELVFDKKEIQKKLFCDISEIIEAGELSFKLIEAQSIFMEVLERIKIEADYDVDVEEGFGTDFFLKAFNVQLKKTGR